MQNNYRNFGKEFPKIASTDFKVGDFVCPDGAGAFEPCTGGTGDVKGICNEVISSTDADYAVVRPINITQTVDDVEFDVVVTANGPATSACVGQYIEVDAADASGVDYATLNAAATGKDFFITGFKNASLITVKAL